MKVLFGNRDHTALSGGDSNKIEHYQRHLFDIGVTADYTSEVRYPDYNDYDIIHGFHLGHKFSHKFYLEAARLEKPFVLSPIHFPEQENPLVYRHDMVDYASAIACLSDGELKSVQDIYVNDDGKKMVSDKTYIIPNGINPIYGTDGPKLKHPNCPEEDYVLCVGRIDGRKNQAKLAQACYELDIPLMLVGSAANAESVAQVQAIADIWEGLWWEPSAPAEKLVEAYRGAKVLACPSTLEMWPNVVAEGGLAGCNLVVGNGSMSFTDMKEVYACDNTVDSIKEAVIDAYSATRRNEQRPFSTFTWERAAGELKEMYEGILQ